MLSDFTMTWESLRLGAKYLNAYAIALSTSVFICYFSSSVDQDPLVTMPVHRVAPQPFRLASVCIIKSNSLSTKI